MRNLKGKSLIDFPSDYVVVDIETTGLDVSYDKIIEISAVRYKENIQVDKFSELVKARVDEFITDLTGITNDMLKNAREVEEVLSSLKNFITPNDIIVAHNANFDINFLYDNFQKINVNFSNDFIDTLRIARLLKTDMKSHRLKDLCKIYRIDDKGHHRAETDCIITASIFQFLKDDFYKKWGELENFISSQKRSETNGVVAKNFISRDASLIYEDSPLFGKVCVITGVLQKMTRREAMQIIVDIGGINGDSVTKDTNFLILGNNDYCTTIVGGKSTKHKRAEKLKLKGQDIEIISENTFYDMIGLNI